MSKVEDHLRAKHRTEWMRYAHNHTTIYVFWDCTICSKRMQRVEAAISRHLKRHNISSIRKYEQVYGLPEMNQGSGKVELGQRKIKMEMNVMPLECGQVQASNELSTWRAHIKQEADVGNTLDTATNASLMTRDSSASMKIEQFLNHASEVSPKVVGLVVMCQMSLKM